MYEISLVATTLTYLVASSTLIRLKRAHIFLCFRNVTSLFILQLRSSNAEKLVFRQLRIKVMEILDFRLEIHPQRLHRDLRPYMLMLASMEMFQ